MVFNSLSNAIPVPEIRTDIDSDPKDDKGAPPKEVQVLIKWFGWKHTNILRDILEVATMIKNIKKNKKKISSNYLVLTLKKDNQWSKLSVNPIIPVVVFECPVLVFETLRNEI